jgi:hypothetical protein
MAAAAVDIRRRLIICILALYAPYTHSFCSSAFSPKHLGHGIASGVSNVVAGAVGAVGLVVLFPVS